jgi:ribosomal protein L37E
VRIIEGCAPTRTLKSQGLSHATPAGTISRDAAKAAKMFTGPPLFACPGFACNHAAVSRVHHRRMRADPHVEKPGTISRHGAKAAKAFTGKHHFACSAALRATTPRLRVRIIEGCAPTRTLKSQGQSHATPAGTISRHAGRNDLTPRRQGREGFYWQASLCVLCGFACNHSATSRAITPRLRVRSLRGFACDAPAAARAKCVV